FQTENKLASCQNSWQENYQHLSGDSVSFQPCPKMNCPEGGAAAQQNCVNM
ncbi:hypothetical protein NQZ68_004855, partial [Dissostichus eleginoides]